MKEYFRPRSEEFAGSKKFTYATARYSLAYNRRDIFNVQNSEGLLFFRRFFFCERRQSREED